MAYKCLYHLIRREKTQNEKKNTPVLTQTLTALLCELDVAFACFPESSHLLR